MTRIALIAVGLALLVACVPEGPVEEKGPPLEIVEAARAIDTTRVVLRYKDGGAIPPEDDGRAMARAMQIACREGENPIPDTRERANGLLTVRVFCVGVVETDVVVNPPGIRL